MLILIHEILLAENLNELSLHIFDDYDKHIKKTY